MFTLTVCSLTVDAVILASIRAKLLFANGSSGIVPLSFPIWYSYVDRIS